MFNRLISRIVTAVAAVLLSAVLVLGAGVDCRGFKSTPLRIVAKGGMTRYWILKAAELRETPSATWGYVRLQNLSSTPIVSARFYGEYFSADGRFCFSLAFSLRSNEEGASPPIRPGEALTVRSMTSAIVPAVAPAEMRIYLVGQETISGERIAGGDVPPLRVPPLITAGVIGSLSSVTLHGEIVPPADSIRDLAFARVRIDISGRPDKTDILYAGNEMMRQWLMQFVSESRGFMPASAGKVPETGDLLILVRAVSSRSAFENTNFLPRLSPVVTAFLSTLHGDDIPTISMVIFGPAPTRIKRLGSTDWTPVLPAPPPGLFSILTSETDWCGDLFDYKPGRLPSQFVREWKK